MAKGKVTGLWEFVAGTPALYGVVVEDASKEVIFGISQEECSRRLGEERRVGLLAEGRAAAMSRERGTQHTGELRSWSSAGEVPEHTE